MVCCYDVIEGLNDVIGSQLLFGPITMVINQSRPNFLVLLISARVKS